MTAVVRLGDSNDGGGIVTTIPQTTVFVNGILGSVTGSIGSGHPPCPTIQIHCQGLWSTIANQSKVFFENIPVNQIGDSDTCGHSRINGSPDTFIV